MKFSIKMGLVFIAVALICGAVNYFAMTDGNYYPKLLFLVPFLFAVGLVMIIFPGAEPGPEVPSGKQLSYMFSKSKILTKIMWILFTILGLAGGVMLLISVGG